MRREQPLSAPSRHKIGHNCKSADARSAQTFWCERGDSNPHGFTRQILSLVRLPIPPLSQPEQLYKAAEILSTHVIQEWRHTTRTGAAIFLPDRFTVRRSVPDR